MTDSSIRQPVLGPRGWARWGWRQLTSMRTALVLLMLLALAAIPGSVWPQRGIDPVRVREYLDENPAVGPWLDRFGFFDVYASPWFASIYLLLMISLVGCIVPRTGQHWRAVRAQPPRTPRFLARLPEHRRVELEAEPERVLAAAREALGRRRFRIRAAEDDRPHEVAAEGGYLRETGNLVFHISLLGIIVFVGVGHLWGWRGEVILAEGETFTSTVSRYDTLQPGPWVGEDQIQPFVLTLDELDVQFETEASGSQFGAPRKFRAAVSTAEDPDGPVVRQELAVNHPLNLGGTSVYLLGNGYAPVVTVRDAAGNVLYSQATPFLPQDDFYASTGAVKVPAAEPDLGLTGAFLPTLRFDEELGPVSDFPGLVSPGLVLTVYEGDLFPEGRPQSVYSLDVTAMEQVLTDEGEPTRLLLRPGETIELPGGRGSVTLDGVVRWGGLVMREDPGRVPVLVSAFVMLAGLTAMLAVRRRRVFVRVTPAAGGDGRHTGVEVAGLAKGSDPSLGALVDEVLEDIREQLGPVRQTDLTTEDSR